MATVLIVDDEPDIRYLLRRQFEHGAPAMPVVGEADSASEAFALWRKLRPDVVVLDHRLHGESGVGAAGKILAEDPDQIIIMFTAYRDPALEQDLESLGVRAILPKVELERLGTVIRAALESPRRRPLGQA